MGWRVFGERFETADFSGSPRVYQKITFNSDIVLLAIRTSFIVYNDPTFTALSLKIYSNNAGAPGKLLHTSTNTVSKTSLCTLENGVKECYFEFTNKPMFKGLDSYILVPACTGYTGDEDEHLAWMRAFPDGVYDTNVDQTFENLCLRPFQLTVIGAEV